MFFWKSTHLVMLSKLGNCPSPRNGVERSAPFTSRALKTVTGLVSRPSSQRRFLTGSSPTIGSSNKATSPIVGRSGDESKPNPKPWREPNRPVLERLLLSVSSSLSEWCNLGSFDCIQLPSSQYPAVAIPKKGGLLLAQTNSSPAELVGSEIGASDGGYEPYREVSSSDAANASPYV
ncbi:hypothetical protein V565_065090 [Rhizoctonia solani 123E]|uniref:Uncharacterized protein n=1 Tax=Rhizoctonia solani 123E TaxID=1423351 RepID=A0A074RW06_9AGAM|nr:hypothetical protein V565_065090 [Rhizoctonia solani 123E]